MLIVTLTSIPPRFGAIGPTLECLLAQSVAPDRIRLHIPRAYRRFPDWDGTMPGVPAGVEICRVAEDFGPATKVLPAARAFAGQDVELLFCDDDRAYQPDWAETFLRARAAHPDAVICRIGRQAESIAASQGAHRKSPRAVRRWRITDWRFQCHRLARRIRQGPGAPEPMRKIFKRAGYVDVFEGLGGVMLKPAHIPAEAYDIPEVLWSVDDIWLSGMVTQAGTPIWIEANLMEPPLTRADAKAPLYQAVIDGADRSRANALGVAYMQKTYGIWL